MRFGRNALAARGSPRRRGSGRTSAREHARRSEPYRAPARARFFARLVLFGFAVAADASLVCVAHGAETVLSTLGDGVAAQVQNAVRLRIQQTISALPPANGQPTAYVWDPVLDTFVKSRLVPPTVFLTPSTLGRGVISLKGSISYFDLRPLHEEVDERFTFVADSGGAKEAYARFGVKASARAAVFGIAAGCGLTDAIDLNFVLPIVLVNARASVLYSSSPSAASDALFGGIEGTESPETLEAALESGELTLAAGQLGGPLDGGTNVGIGRSILGAKVRLVTRESLELAFVPSVALRSPSSDELAGTDTTAFFPRFASALALDDHVRLLGDLGYDGDLEENELRRFVWNVGGSLLTDDWSVDLGLGGSLYNEGISILGDTVRFQNSLVVAPTSSTELPTNLIDVLVGFKVKLRDGLLVSGAATIPVVNVEFRPNAIGTIALEKAF